METFAIALSLIVSGDAELYEIVGLSLKVSLSAVVLASLIGIPLGAILASRAFWGRDAIVVLATTFMALPPVVAGLAIYLLLSRAGPLGSFGLLFTTTAMIIAQAVLIFPIVTALTREAVLPLNREYRDLLVSVDASFALTLRTLVWDARFAIATAILAGFGRAIAEVGAVLIVGGNIDGVTRVMTTTIALETSKGNLEIALALGVVLLLLAFAVNLATFGVSRIGQRYQVAE